VEDSAETDIVIVKRDHICSITIDRPGRRNALALSTMDRLGTAIETAARDHDVWVIVLQGSGNEAFCAGADLKEAATLAANGGGYPHPMTGTRRNLFELLLETPKPTIAALNGTALGAGFELALACDIRLLASHAVVGLPEAKRGMGANFGSAMLPRLVPRAIAYDLLYTGRSVDAAEAVRIGLVSRVFGQADFRTAVDEYARTIAANAPLTVQRYKHMIMKGGDLPIHAALRLDAGPNPYASEDRIEGTRAFVEKRQPVWRGR